MFGRNTIIHADSEENVLGYSTVYIEAGTSLILTLLYFKKFLIQNLILKLSLRYWISFELIGVFMQILEYAL